MFCYRRTIVAGYINTLCPSFTLAPHRRTCVILATNPHEYCELRGIKPPYQEYLDRTTVNGFGLFVKKMSSLANDGDVDALKQCKLLIPCKLSLYDARRYYSFSPIPHTYFIVIRCLFGSTVTPIHDNYRL